MTTEMSATPWWPTTRPCPHCGAQHDISRSLHGDRVWCARCDKWYAVVLRTNGDVYLAKVEPPTTR